MLFLLLFLNSFTVSLERWCRLRGNLLFYFKSKEQWSEPMGVIILEQCSYRIEPPTSQIIFGFSIGNYIYFILFYFIDCNYELSISVNSMLIKKYIDICNYSV